MAPKRALAALSLSLVLAAGALAQEAAAPADAEFGRASSGPLDLMTKRPKSFSGTLGLTSSQFSLGSRSGGRGYSATLGGTVVPDRVWFFAAAERSTPLFSSQSVSQPAASPAFDAKMTGQLGDRQSLAATFAAARQSQPAIGSPFAPYAVPTNFLSLHYTGIVTDSMFFTASFSDSRRSGN